MPLLKIESLGPCTQLGVWKIDEEKEALENLADLDPVEEVQYVSFKSEVRKKQWLSYRVLLQKMLSPDPFFLEYDAYGKPRLRNSGLYLSISHSGDYSAVITSKKVSVGIDIERLKDRILRIKDRFLSVEEDLNISEPNRLGPRKPSTKFVEGPKWIFNVISLSAPLLIFAAEKANAAPG